MIIDNQFNQILESERKNLIYEELPLHTLIQPSNEEKKSNN